MKAKEYAKDYLEYFDEMRNIDLTIDEKQEKINRKTFDILLGIAQEAADLVSNSGRSFNNAFKEGKDKWLAFSSIVNKNLGAEVIKANGFKDYWEQKIPEIKLLEMARKTK